MVLRQKVIKMDKVVHKKTPKPFPTNLHPKNWSVTVRRIVGGIVVFLDLAVIVIAFILAARTGGFVGSGFPLYTTFTYFVGLLTFLFVWLIVALQVGFWKGLLVALALVVGVISSSMLLDGWLK